MLHPYINKLECFFFYKGSPSVLDPPEHLFRIRLVCILLDTCGQYFDRGSLKRKLDCFIVYFQVLNHFHIVYHTFTISIPYHIISWPYYTMKISYYLCTTTNFPGVHMEKEIEWCLEWRLSISKGSWVHGRRYPGVITSETETSQLFRRSNERRGRTQLGISTENR